MRIPERYGTAEIKGRFLLNFGEYVREREYNPLGMRFCKFSSGVQKNLPLIYKCPITEFVSEF
jgi:hypothetical protein